MLDGVFFIGDAALLRLRVRLGSFFTCPENSGQSFANRHNLTFLRGNLADGAVLLGLEIEVDLVGLDLQDRLAFLDRLARPLVPADHLPLGHRVAHLGHDDFCHKKCPVLSAQCPVPPAQLGTGHWELGTGYYSLYITRLTAFMTCSS